jgi:DNA transformation protein
MNARRSRPRDSKRSDVLLNLGPVSREWLEQIGITSHAELEGVGAVEAYRRVKTLGVKPTLNLLCAMHAALQDVHWTMLPPKVRADLGRRAEGSE